jgi:hypothetical protein
MPDSALAVYTIGIPTRPFIMKVSGFSKIIFWSRRIYGFPGVRGTEDLFFVVECRCGIHYVIIV